MSNPPPRAEAVALADSGRSGAANAYVGTELELFQDAVHWKGYVRRQLAPYLRGDVLEVGAGIGGTTRSLCDGRQRRWVALEPDRAMAAQLEQDFAARPLPLPVEVVAGTLADLPADARFDAILYVDVLEHIEHDRDELRLAAALLRAGGAVVVLAPAHQWLFTAFDRGIGHFRRYTIGSLRAVAPAGVVEERAFYLDAVGMLASAANRALLRSAMPTRAQLAFWDRCLVRASRWVDPLLAHRIGKTVVVVWRKP